MLTVSSNSIENLAQATPKDKIVSYWLFGCSGLVFGMVALGGVTRLTRSGLSMTDWNLAGKLPPLTAEAWETEFDTYKQFPEFQKVNQDLTLEQFKFIYFMEWGHRMFGRFIGFAFALPFAYFAIRGRINTSLAKRLGLIFVLGGTQGLIGWWMVKSGLEEPQDESDKRFEEPRVSPYRLATHLISAFGIYSLLLSTAISQYPFNLSSFKPAPKSFKYAVAGTVLLVGSTALSGAYVAGNNAGLVYNEFPKMGGRWFPQDYLKKGLEPRWRNCFENSSLVQWEHRALAMTTWTASLGLFLLSRRFYAIGKVGRAASLVSSGLFGMATVQASLGIVTLLYYVPVPLAAVHQSGSLILLSIGITLLHTI